MEYDAFEVVPPPPPPGTHLASVMCFECEMFSIDFGVQVLHDIILKVLPT